MRVEKYQLKDWEDSEQGLLITENEDWILVKHIPTDYLIDGYKLYRKEFIAERSRADEEEKVEKVLSLKKVKQEAPKGFEFRDAIGYLKWLETTYGLFEFQDDDDTELFYGKINRVEDQALIIDMIKTDGSVEADYDYEFELNEIRVITFETDYFNSVRLLWQDQLKTQANGSHS